MTADDDALMRWETDGGIADGEILAVAVEPDDDGPPSLMCLSTNERLVLGRVAGQPYRKLSQLFPTNPLGPLQTAAGLLEKKSLVTRIVRTGEYAVTDLGQRVLDGTARPDGFGRNGGPDRDTVAAGSVVRGVTAGGGRRHQGTKR